MQRNTRSLAGLFVCYNVRVKRTPLRRKARKPAKRSKSPDKGYKPPQWFNAILPGGHGSTPAQKRLWRVISETYRQQDFEMFGPYCPCCGMRFGSWRDGQLGHWLRYSLCNGFFKYERANLALICAGCNYKDDAITLKKLGEALQLRYGSQVLDWIEQENQRHRGKKIETWACVDYAARVAPHLSTSA